MNKYLKIFIIELCLVVLVVGYIFWGKQEKEITLSCNGYTDNNNNDNIQDKKVYKDIEKKLKFGEENVSIALDSLLLKPEKIFSIIEDINYNNSDIMYYKGAEYSFGKIKLQYSKPKDQIIEHRKTIKDIKDNFIRRYIKDNMSDYEKVLAVHDYIIDSSEYDTRLYDLGEIPAESYSSYGVLALGVGVCESYARAIKYLLDDIGIESMIVIGTSRGENHAWNLINIEGDYYHLDATWDDPISENGESIIRHNFFNLKDEEIGLTHEWNRDDYPKASGEKYNYYKYNNLIVLGKDELSHKLKGVILGEVADYSVKMLNFDKEKDIDINKILKDISYKNYNQINLRGYSYYFDQDQGILTFKFYYD